MQRFNARIDFESGRQEDRKGERVVRNALSWVRSNRLGDKPIHL
jgi:hypothetical protein